MQVRVNVNAMLEPTKQAAEPAKQGSRKYNQSKWKQFRTVWYGGNPSKVAVATSSIMNIKLKILVIENKTTH